MPDYRVYTLGEGGHIKGRTADGHAVEVWEYDRRIALIDGKTARLRLALYAQPPPLPIGHSGALFASPFPRFISIAAGGGERQAARPSFAK